MQADWFTDQTGGLFVDNDSEPLRWGRGTDGADGDGSDMTARCERRAGGRKGEVRDVTRGKHSL